MELSELIQRLELLEERILKLEKNQEEKIHNPRFKPPTHEEVADYFISLRPLSSPTDALSFSDVFISHYTNTGWRYGKHKMKDWKSAMRSSWDLNKFVNKNNKNNESIGRVSRNDLQEWVNS